MGNEGKVVEMKFKDSVGGTLKNFINQPVAILCMRYWYRGKLVHVAEDHIVLENPCAVEQTGSANATEPTQENEIPSSLIIKTMAIEIVCQPAWVFHGWKQDGDTFTFESQSKENK